MVIIGGGKNKGDKVLRLNNHDRTHCNGFKLNKFRFKTELGRH